MANEKTAARKAGPKGNGKNDPLGTNTEIGRKLRQYYDELMADDVPDRFTELLKQLEQKESDRSGTERN
ncbi:NepR family anti-sigma factor [Aquibium sp. A9E412]|uniref:NepR family anti-sigma factor n=1 Tax=Aquibium sp. A9E412 TaxID=2976767 RepID=UPI0025B133BB|nr:NepR family anti-sigma factor [Aquibium sp. A9E412]MDN2565395.1 NepR family anti-sigma factor [Aquibium sp. A9E412]